MNSIREQHRLIHWSEDDARGSTSGSECGVARDPGISRPSAERAGAIKILRDKYIMRALAAITRNLSAPDLPESERDRLLSRKAAFNRLKQTPLTSRSDQD